MKKVLIGLVVIIVIVAGVLFYVWQNLGSLIKTAVEKAGSDVTQVKVSLKDVDTSDLTHGGIALRGLVIGNPPGFKTASAMKLGEISVKVDPATVTSNTIVVKEVVIGSPEITYEFGANGSNIGTIQKNVEKVAGGGKGGGTSASESGGSKKKVVIDNLYIRNGKVNVSADFLQGKTAGANLPTIHLTNIGKGSGGATPSQVAEKVIAAISKSATSAVGKLDISGIKDALSKELGSKMGDMQKTLQQGTGGASDMLKKGTSGAEEGIKKLFGK